MAVARCGVIVTMGWVDWAISSCSKEAMREAWIAAPRAERVEGGIAVGRVEGARIVVGGGKREVRLVAMRGVWEVPPERITWVVSVGGWGRGQRVGGVNLVDVQNVEIGFAHGFFDQAGEATEDFSR